MSEKKSKGAGKRKRGEEAAPPPRETVPAAALALAGEKGWENVSLRDIAARAGVGLGELYDLYCDKTDILAGYGRMVDRATLARFGGISEGDFSPRERLFDLLMERFEVLNAQREGVRSVLRGLWRDPKQAVIGAPHLARSMAWMLAAAGVDTAGLAGAARVAGMSAMYLRLLKVWSEDDSPDMGSTMAALDRMLERAERFSGARSRESA